jgi:SLT domain-containing protein
MTESEMIVAAQNRQSVELLTGERVQLISWGGTRANNRARIVFPSGRERTVRKTEILGLKDF